MPKKNSSQEICSSIDYFPSFSIFKSLIRKINKSSLTRALQNHIIENYNFPGDLLDFGGGDKSHYRSIINCKSYKSINIDPGIIPTWVVKEDEPFPCPNEKFDCIFSFNTLEHIFNAHEKFYEFYRVLRPKGEILISTPFLYPVHGHPDDFFRPTPSWYFESLKRCGFKRVKVIPLFWGPFSTGLTASGTLGPFKNVRKKIALLFDFLLISIKRLKYSKQEIEKIYMPISTAFLIHAIK